MTKTILTAIAGLSVAGIASAAPISGDFNLLDPSMYTLTAPPLDSADAGRGELDPSFYSAIDGPYTAFAAATGTIGFDDYGTDVEDDILLTSFRFVGGVAEVDGTMSFQFFDSDENLVDSFGVTLPQGGNFIWTITLNSEAIVPAATSSPASGSSERPRPSSVRTTSRSAGTRPTHRTASNSTACSSRPPEPSLCWAWPASAPPVAVAEPERGPISSCA